jgi:hypothetical protein
LHRSLFFHLLLDEPVHELLARVVVRVARDLQQFADADGVLALELEGEPDGFHVVREIAPGRSNLAEPHLRVGIDEVADHLHRMLAFFFSLLVEEVGEPRKGLGAVVDLEGDVLVGGGELTRDLLVQRVHEALGWHGVLLVSTAADCCEPYPRRVTSTSCGSGGRSAYPPLRWLADPYRAGHPAWSVQTYR